MDQKIKEIQVLIRSGQDEELQKVLKEDPSISSHQTEQGISLLQYALYCRNTAAVELLKKYKGEFNIFEASSVGDLETVAQATVKEPAVVNSYSADGFTPLGLASYFGHPKIVKSLLQKKADPNLAAKNSFKVAPLHSACATSNVEVAKILLDAGADVNAVQASNVTPLHSAAHNGASELVKLLLEHGANRTSETDDGKTSEKMAEENNFPETAQLIRNYSVKS